MASPDGVAPSQTVSVSMPFLPPNQQHQSTEGKQRIRIRGSPQRCYRHRLRAFLVDTTNEK